MGTGTGRSGTVRVAVAGKQLEFGSLKTNGKAIAVHTLIFFALYAILIIAACFHIYTG